FSNYSSVLCVTTETPNESATLKDITLLTETGVREGDAISIDQ
ncbi:16592_t:CDS:2, partial [Dentiscutata erythropus]